MQDQKINHEKMVHNFTNRFIWCIAIILVIAVIFHHNKTQINNAPPPINMSGLHVDLDYFPQDRISSTITNLHYYIVNMNLETIGESKYVAHLSKSDPTYQAKVNQLTELHRLLVVMVSDYNKRMNNYHSIVNLPKHLDMNHLPTQYYTPFIRHHKGLNISSIIAIPIGETNAH